MKNRTLRVIISPLRLLELNIGAAHTGITHKVKLITHNEFSQVQLPYMSFVLTAIATIAYVIVVTAFTKRPI